MVQPAFAEATAGRLRQPSLRQNARVRYSGNGQPAVTLSKVGEEYGIRTHATISRGRISNPARIAQSAGA